MTRLSFIYLVVKTTNKPESSSTQLHQQHTSHNTRCMSHCRLQIASIDNKQTLEFCNAEPALEIRIL